MSEGRRNDEAGIALVLALMALLLLTFLGLTLATTTSTELQIATNYRWSQQAFYNAEAGIEAGKRILATADWNVVLLAPRTTATWTGSATPGSAAGTASNRNFENWNCDRRGNGMGYGRVLNDGTNTYANVSSYAAQNLGGAFTLWVRRPVVVFLENGNADGNANTIGGQYMDSTNNDELILTAEGVAPYTGAGTSTIAQANRAVRTIEVRLARSLSLSDQCGARRGGQVGGGSEGAGFGGCSPVDSGSVDRALGQTRTGAATTSTAR